MQRTTIRPQIIHAAAKRWPALSRWSFDYLKETIGDKAAVISNQQIAVKGKKLTVADYIEQANNPEPGIDLPYLHAASIPTHYPELLPDLQPDLQCFQPNFMNSALLPWKLFGYPEGKLGFPELLIGAPGAGIPELHYDIGFEHAFITQVIGDKDFFVFPPEDGDKLYPRPHAPCQSSIDNIENPDLQRFPLLRQASMQRISLRQGETLFIPSGWWHISKSITPGVAISFNSVSAVNWQAFVDYKVAQVKSPQKKSLLQAHLGITGVLLKLQEQLVSKHRQLY